MIWKRRESDMCNSRRVPPTFSPYIGPAVSCAPHCPVRTTVAGITETRNKYASISAALFLRWNRSAFRFIFSLTLTTGVAFFAMMLIPDNVRRQYFENLIAGISMFLAGPYGAKLGFHALVVLVGLLILSGAVNTAIIGSNGVLNRVVETVYFPTGCGIHMPHTEPRTALFISS